MATSANRKNRIVTSRGRRSKKLASFERNEAPIVTAVEFTTWEHDESEWASFHAAIGTTRARLLKEGV